MRLVRYPIEPLDSNSIGKAFVITCFGESHGKCVSVVIDGCPAGLPISEGEIQAELDKRTAGMPSELVPRREEDKVEIISGVFQGRSTGAPICLLIRNRRFDSAPYKEFRTKPRPGQGARALC